MRESLDGIGEEVNELFFSNIESDGNKEEELKQIEQEFGSLLDWSIIFNQEICWILTDYNFETMQELEYTPSLYFECTTNVRIA